MSRRTKAGARAVRTTKKPVKSKRTLPTKDSPTEEEMNAIETTFESPAPMPPPHDARRTRRTRPTPSWLREHQDHDEMARRRVLMILRVLSGETPVTDAIEGTDISRQMYYQLEERGLRAMMRALTPGGESLPASGPDPAILRRISELETRTKQLEQEKRRAERMLYLTRKVVPTGPMKSNQRGRPSRAPNSATSGARGSRASTTSKISTSAPAPVEDGTADSTPKRSEGEPHGGTAS